MGADGEVICWLATESANSHIEIAAIWVPIAIAVAALVISTITACYQIKLQKQEWRPYLTYEKIDVDKLGNTVYFELFFKNIGKSILQYKVSKFSIKFDNPNDVTEFQERDYVYVKVYEELAHEDKNWDNAVNGIIIPNSSHFFKGRYYHVNELINWNPGIICDENDDECNQYCKKYGACVVVADCEINSTIEYWKVGNSYERHKISLCITLTFLRNGQVSISQTTTDAT